MTFHYKTFLFQLFGMKNNKKTYAPYDQHPNADRNIQPWGLVGWRENQQGIGLRRDSFAWISRGVRGDVLTSRGHPHMDPT